MTQLLRVHAVLTEDLNSVSRIQCQVTHRLPVALASINICKCMHKHTQTQQYLNQVLRTSKDLPMFVPYVPSVHILVGQTVNLSITK